MRHRKIVRDQDLCGITVVCWGTLLDDRAAKVFMRGFCDALSDVLHDLHGESPGPLPFKDAFKAGCATFSKEEFQWGDPKKFLPVEKNRKPPVHGIALLHSKSKSGEFIWFCEEPDLLVARDDVAPSRRIPLLEERELKRTRRVVRRMEPIGMTWQSSARRASSRRWSLRAR